MSAAIFMKQLSFTLILSLYLSISAHSQSTVFTIDRPLIRDIDSIELVNSGKTFSYTGITFSISKDYFPNSEKFNLGQPINSNRLTTPIKTKLSYYYSLPDSIIRLIEYSWDATIKDTSLLANIFENNSKQFSSSFSNTGKTTMENHENWTQRTTIWEDQSKYIKQFMVLGSYTYRVRVLISWK